MSICAYVYVSTYKCVFDYVTYARSVDSVYVCRVFLLFVFVFCFLLLFVCCGFCLFVCFCFVFCLFAFSQYFSNSVIIRSV